MMSTMRSLSTNRTVGRLHPTSMPPTSDPTSCVFRSAIVLTGTNLRTMKSKSLVILYTSLVVSLLALSSCVHEMPSTEKGEVYIDLLFDMELLPTYQEIYYDLNANTRANRVGSEEMELRYLVRCYPASSDSTYSDVAAYEFNYTNRDLSQLDYRCHLSLVPGRYKIRVWADYIRVGDIADLFYNTDNFADISIAGDKQDYQGSTEMRSAFIGEQDIDIPATTNLDEPVRVGARIEMIRPMAKYKFVTTDLADFIEKYLGITDPDEVARVNLSDYQIMFRYTGFLPTHFNIFTDKPFDAAQGYSFMSSITEAGNGEATLGFDYVFVNGHPSSVSVAIGIYNKEGMLLSFSSPIEVPLMRNKQTIVRGRFLTTASSGTIAINEEYDGNYNITVY